MLINLLAAETTAALTDAAAAVTEAADVDEEINAIKQFFENLFNNILLAIPDILIAIGLLILGILLSKLVVRLMKKGLERSKVDLTVNHFLISLVKIVLYVLVFTVTLTLLGVPMTSIIAVIGTAGVAISLALQNILSNVAGGFIILVFKPFRVGNYIMLKDAEGYVECINILYTKLRTYNNRAVYIPNGVASSATLTNATEAEKRRVDNVFSISYNADYQKAVDAINKAIAKCPKILTTDENKPFVRMCAHGRSSIDIAVRVWCNTDDYWDVYFDVIENVRAQFIEESIEIPYHQVDIHMKD